MKTTIGVRSNFTKEQITNLLDSASRGADYWCENELAYESETDKALSETDFSLIKITDSEPTEIKYCKLNLGKIKKGLTVMAKKEPKHFADFVSEDYDAVTGDVFLQCCLFGKVLYG